MKIENLIKNSLKIVKHKIILCLKINTLVCDDPTMTNSNISIVNLIESSDKSILSGTTVALNCDEGYKNPETVSTCGLDGKWNPALFCYPGFCFVCVYTELKDNTLISFTNLKIAETPQTCRIQTKA